MKHAPLILLTAAIAAVASAQTGSSPAKSSSTTPASVKPATAASTALAPWIKLPPGVPRVVHGPIKVPFSLRYEDIKIGTGAEGEPGKLWHLKYTVWRAADGVKIDSWLEHGPPVFGKDGKPELGPDGRPKFGEPQPALFALGMGRVIPGFDYGLDGMKVGGTRRIFVPWQLAYGTRSVPDRPEHPGFPPKSDLIFDVELVDVTDMPKRPPIPQAPGRPDENPRPGAAPTAPAPKPATQAPAAAPPAAQPQQK